MLTREKTPLFRDVPPEKSFRAGLRNFGRWLRNPKDMAAGLRRSRTALRRALDGLLRDPLYVRLPFEEKRLGLTLAALLAITLYVSFLAIATHGVFEYAVTGLDRDTARRVTFEVLPNPERAGDPKDREDRAALLAGKLRETPGVAHVARLPDSAIAELLSPWLGGAAPVSELPLPALVDVRLAATAPAGKTALMEIARSVPGVTMDDHAAWQNALTRAAHGLAFTASYVLALGFVALALMAYFAAETHFHINRDTIEILHLIGARDAAIARHMGLAVLRIGLLAAGVAFAAGLLTLAGLGLSLQGLDLSFFPNFSPGASGVALIVAKWAGAGLLAALLCFATAYMTVLRELREMI